MLKAIKSDPEELVKYRESDSYYDPVVSGVAGLWPYLQRRCIFPVRLKSDNQAIRQAIKKHDFVFVLFWRSVILGSAGATFYELCCHSFH